MEKEKNYDIVIGIPSFNEQTSIPFVTNQIDKGLHKHYPNNSSLIIDCDNGSTDLTKDTFNNIKTKTPSAFMETKKGDIGKGYALKMLFELTKKFNAKAGACFDADLRSITPDWIKLQLGPIMEGYDFISPDYVRYKYDATITNNICYPLMYGLFCHDIRNPIGGDFAYSREMNNYWLEKAHWTKNTSLFGIDIFMTTNAILGGFKVAQSNLGIKAHKPKDPSKSLSPMFRQVISTLFKTIILNKEKLLEFNKVKKVPLLGNSKKVAPEEFYVDIESTKKRFISGFAKHKDLIKKCISKEDFAKVWGCAYHNKVYLPQELWTKIVYDYIITYKKYESNSSEILQSFTPLWFARIYSFINDTIDMNTEKADIFVQNQAKEFFKQRHYLLDRL